MVSSENLFHALPKELQTMIDEAFIATVRPNSSGFQKPMNKSGPPSSGGGGFLMEDNESPGGVFFNDLENAEGEGPEGSNQILLGLIPAALQRLDLPPDDPEVLAVFRNAASGWTSSSLNSLGISPSTETYVGRDDWRSVCAVLLEGRAPAFDDGRSFGNSPDSAHLDEDDEDASMTDDYVEDNSPSQSDLEQEGSDEEYQEAAVGNARRRGNHITSSTRYLSQRARLSEKPGQPTSRQRQTCLNTFALFFPEVPFLKLSEQKIMVADIQRIAKLLGEKIKADEVRTLFQISRFSNSRSRCSKCWRCFRHLPTSRWILVILLE